MVPPLTPSLLPAMEVCCPWHLNGSVSPPFVSSATWVTHHNWLVSKHVCEGSDPRQTCKLSVIDTLFRRYLTYREGTAKPPAGATAGRNAQRRLNASMSVSGSRRGAGAPLRGGFRWHLTTAPGGPDMPIWRKRDVSAQNTSMTRRRNIQGNTTSPRGRDASSPLEGEISRGEFKTELVKKKKRSLFAGRGVSKV